MLLLDISNILLYYSSTKTRECTVYMTFPAPSSPEAQGSPERESFRFADIGHHEEKGPGKAASEDRGGFNAEAELADAIDGISHGNGAAAAEFIHNRLQEPDIFGEKWVGLTRNEAAERFIAGLEKIDADLAEAKKRGDIPQESCAVGVVFKYYIDTSGKRRRLVGGSGDSVGTRTRHDAHGASTIRLNYEQTLAASMARSTTAGTYDPNKGSAVTESWSGTFGLDARTSKLKRLHPLKIDPDHISDTEVQTGDVDIAATDGNTDRILYPNGNIDHWTDEYVSPGYRKIAEDISLGAQQKAEKFSEIEKAFPNPKRDDHNMTIVVHGSPEKPSVTPPPSLGERAVLSTLRTKRQETLRTRRQELDDRVAAHLETLLPGDTHEAQRTALAEARHEAIEAGVAMQRSSRRQQRGLRRTLEAKLRIYNQALGSLPDDALSVESARRLRTLDAHDTRLRIHEQTGLKGAAMEMLAKRRWRFLAMGAVALAGAGVTASVVATGGGLGIIAGGGMIGIMRAARGYGTAMSRRYAQEKMEFSVANPAAREKHHMRTLYLSLGLTAVSGALLLQNAILNTHSKLVYGIGGFGFILGASSMTLAASKAGNMANYQKDPHNVENMATAKERAGFVTSHIQEMVRQDQRTKNMAIGSAAIAAFMGAGGSELLHHAWDSLQPGTHSPNGPTRTPATREPKTVSPTPRRTSASPLPPERPTPTHTPTHASPAPSPTPSAPESPAPPVRPPEQPRVPRRPITGDNNGNGQIDANRIDVGNHVTHLSPGEQKVEFGAGFYDTMDKLYADIPQLRDLSPAEYYEVHKNVGARLAEMKGPSGEPLAFKVTSGGRDWYGFNYQGEIVDKQVARMFIEEAARVKGVDVAA